MQQFIVYVEKKQGFDIEARGVKKELKTFLGLNNIEEVRVFNRYDVAGVTEEAYEKAIHTVFSEPQSDDVYEALPELEGFVFMSSYLRGQYDQRADSCVQCIRTIDSKLAPVVKTSKVYCIKGDLTDEEKGMIKRHMINPIES